MCWTDRGLESLKWVFSAVPVLLVWRWLRRPHFIPRRGDHWSQEHKDLLKDVGYDIDRGDADFVHEDLLEDALARGCTVVRVRVGLSPLKRPINGKDKRGRAVLVHKPERLR